MLKKFKVFALLIIVLLLSIGTGFMLSSNLEGFKQERPVTASIARRGALANRSKLKLKPLLRQQNKLAKNNPLSPASVFPTMAPPASVAPTVAPPASVVPTVAPPASVVPPISVAPTMAPPASVVPTMALPESVTAAILASGPGPRASMPTTMAPPASISANIAALAGTPIPRRVPVKPVSVKAISAEEIIASQIESPFSRI